MIEEKYFSLNDEIIFNNEFKWIYKMNKTVNRYLDDMRFDYRTPKIGYEINIDNGDINKVGVTFSEVSIKKVEVIINVGSVTDLVEIRKSKAIKILGDRPRDLTELIQKTNRIRNIKEK